MNDINEWSNEWTELMILTNDLSKLSQQMTTTNDLNEWSKWMI